MEDMAGVTQNWSASGTSTSLEILKELRIVERLNDRKARNGKLVIQVYAWWMKAIYNINSRNTHTQ